MKEPISYSTETEAIKNGQELLKEIDQYFANRKLIIYLVEIWGEDLSPLPTRFAFYSEIRANTKAQELQHIYDNVSVSAITVE